jgi:hypothetical protein
MLRERGDSFPVEGIFLHSPTKLLELTDGSRSSSAGAGSQGNGVYSPIWGPSIRLLVTIEVVGFLLLGQHGYADLSVGWRDWNRI